MEFKLSKENFYSLVRLQFLFTLLSCFLFTHDNPILSGVFRRPHSLRPLTFSTEEVLYVPQQATLIRYDVHTFFL